MGLGWRAFTKDSVPVMEGCWFTSYSLHCDVTAGALSPYFQRGPVSQFYVNLDKSI